MFNTFTAMDSTISLPSTSHTPSLLNIPQSSFLSLPSTAQSTHLSPSFTNLFSANSLSSFLPKFHNQSSNHYQNHHHHNHLNNHNNNRVHDSHNNNSCDNAMDNNVSKSYLDIKLVEPTIFFRGKPEEAVGCILRGNLMLRLSRPTKIKKLQLKFIGKTKTILNEDRRTIASERELISKTWNFLTSNDEESFNDGSLSPLSPLSPQSQQQFPIQQQQQQQQQQPRFKFLKVPFLKSNNNNNNNNNKNHIKKLPAGIHSYPFELFLPGNLPETVNTELGKVSYCLYAKASKSRFTPDIKYRQNVEILRTIPEYVNAEGIGFAREFNNMLSYEISIPKKSYPIGQKIPIEMKICPYIKKLRVNGVKIELIEKTTYTSKNDQKVCDSKVGTTQEMFGFGESRLIDDHDDGDVGNVVYQQNMDLTIPKCPSPIHYSCNTPLVSVAHDLKFAFALTLPYNPPKRAELKINIPITILSCRALEDSVGLPSYEDSCHCPCDPEYLRMARLSQIPQEIFLSNNCKFVIEDYDRNHNDNDNDNDNNDNNNDNISHYSNNDNDNNSHYSNNDNDNISHYSNHSNHSNNSLFSNDNNNNNNYNGHYHNHNNLNLLNIPGNLYVDRLLHNRLPPSYEDSIAESCYSRNHA